MNVFVRLWFLIYMELIEVANILESNLGLNSFIRDYEDTWEWCESHNNQDGMSYDISRKYNWNTGVYDYPVGVFVKKTDGQLSEEDIECLGRRISRVLKVPVFMGDVKYTKGNDFEFYTHKIINEVEFFGGGAESTS